MKRTTADIAAGIRTRVNEYNQTPEGYALRLHLSFATIIHQALQENGTLLDHVENLQDIIDANVNLDFETAGRLLQAIGLRAEFKVCEV